MSALCRTTRTIGSAVHALRSAPSTPLARDNGDDRLNTPRPSLSVFYPRLLPPSPATTGTIGLTLHALPSAPSALQFCALLALHFIPRLPPRLSHTLAAAV